MSKRRATLTVIDLSQPPGMNRQATITLTGKHEQAIGPIDGRYIIRYTPPPKREKRVVAMNIRQALLAVTDHAMVRRPDWPPNIVLMMRRDDLTGGPEDITHWHIHLRTRIAATLTPDDIKAEDWYILEIDNES